MKMRWSSAHSRSQSFDPFGQRRGSITWIESSESSSGWFQLKGLFWLALKHKGNKPKVKGEMNMADQDWWPWDPDRTVFWHTCAENSICRTSHGNIISNKHPLFLTEQEGRRRLRGMCWCKKELPVFWMGMESWVVYATNVRRRDILFRTNSQSLGDELHTRFLCYSKQNLHQYYRIF